MKQQFIDALLNIQYLEPNVITFIEEKLCVQRIQKNTVILPFNEISDKLYFIASGLARGIYLENRKELSAWFVTENNFICSPYSFFNQKPTFEAIELLEDSILISLSFDDLNEIYDKFPITNKIGRLITESYLLLYDERVRSLRFGSEERLRRFLHNYPELFNRISHKYLASFLGIAPETISRALKKKYIVP